MKPATELTNMARRYLELARAERFRYNQEVERALRTYGDHGSLISGVVRDHFPPCVKDRLRQLCASYNLLVDRSLECWRQDRRRLSTWRRLRDEIMQG
jgi:hypothetical protein